MLTIIAVIIALSVLVLFHEGGHFVFSKLSKIKIEEFGVGYPPRAMGLVKIKSSGKWKIFFGKNVPKEELVSTIYSLNWIPFGGFNKIKGEEGGNNDSDSFYTKPKIQRFFSLSGGIIMNVVLAMILFSICFMVGTPVSLSSKELGKNVVIKDSGIQIISVESCSPAEKAGIKIGDMILKIDSQTVKEVSAIQSYIDQKINQEVILEVKRGGQVLDLKVTPQKAKDIFKNTQGLSQQDLEKGVMGVALTQVNVVAYPFYLAIWEGVKLSFVTFWRVIQGVYLILKELIVNHKMVGEAVGVVGIGTFIGQAYQVGFVYFLQFIGLISVAIAVSQLIPFPALDGGRLLFLLIETIRRKPVSQKIEAMIHNIGFMVLILLMVFITYKDLIRLGDKLFSH